MLQKHSGTLTFLAFCGHTITPHDSTGEKPSFLMLGLDLRSPTEAAYLNPSMGRPNTVEGYKEKFMLSLIGQRTSYGSHKEIAETLRTSV